MATSPRTDKAQKRVPFFDKHNKAHSGICDWGRLATRGAISPDKGDSATVCADFCYLRDFSPLAVSLFPNYRASLSPPVDKRAAPSRCIANKEVALKEEKRQR